MAYARLLIPDLDRFEALYLLWMGFAHPGGNHTLKAERRLFEGIGVDPDVLAQKVHGHLKMREALEIWMACGNKMSEEHLPIFADEDLFTLFLNIDRRPDPAAVPEITTVSSYQVCYWPGKVICTRFTRDYCLNSYRGILHTWCPLALNTRGIHRLVYGQLFGQSLNPDQPLAVTYRGIPCWVTTIRFETGRGPGVDTPMDMSHLNVIDVIELTPKFLGLYP